MKKQKMDNPAVIDVRAVPPIDKGPLPPVEFVRHWTAMCGDFKDGKIEKARRMRPEDLDEAGARYLIDHGVTASQIARQYAMTDEELTAALLKFKILGMPPDGADGVVWFTENVCNVSKEPRLRVDRNGIILNHAICREIGENARFVQLGVVRDNRIKMKVAQVGLTLQSVKNRTSTRRITCASFVNLLKKQGVTIPVSFKMTFDESSGCWIGVIDDAEKT